MPKFDTPTPIAAVLDIPAGRVQRRAPHRRPPRRRRLRRRERRDRRDRAGRGRKPPPYRPRPSAALDAGTSYGRIHNALKNTEGTPDLDIHATTAYGNITARSL
ncbi:hypothetical protein [Paractinoplanes globisporus]|uniref:Uncharacterized protein n=1 Tax=Paractinoplanes globisporus TaxID=113565 RepID=A0ABW6WPX2_9ACTN